LFFSDQYWEGYGFYKHYWFSGKFVGMLGKFRENLAEKILKNPGKS
jgi:hypothetical protein